MLEDKSEEVRCLAAYHIGELGLHTLAHALARAAEHASGMSAEVFARVRARLVQAAEHRAALAAERVPAAHGKGARHDS
jgi:hypothetical protein